MEVCPWRQFRRWLDFYELEPWGDERADLRSGIVASILANVNRDPTKSSSFSPYDFMPYLLERPKEESVPMDEQGWNDFKSMMIASGKPIDH